MNKSTAAMTLNHIIYKATEGDHTLKMAWDLVKNQPKVASDLLEAPEAFELQIIKGELRICKKPSLADSAAAVLNILMVLICLVVGSVASFSGFTVMAFVIAVAAVVLGNANAVQIVKNRIIFKQPLHTGQMAV